MRVFQCRVQSISLSGVVRKVNDSVAFEKFRRTAVALMLQLHCRMLPSPLLCHSCASQLDPIACRDDTSGNDSGSLLKGPIAADSLLDRKCILIPAALFPSQTALSCVPP